MSKVLFDLHSHTTASDGSDSPAELVQKAHEAGCKVLAITDHDTLEGLDEARAAAKPLGLNLIRGVEVEIQWDHNGEFHLLGLNLGSKTDGLEELLKDIRHAREERNITIISKMKEAGMAVDYEEFKARNPKTIIGRPHIARYLIEQGYVKQYQQAFDQYLACGRPFYVPKKALDLDKVIAAIHQAGGKAVVAHPNTLFLSWKNLDTQLGNFKQRGLDGVEAYHSMCSHSHTKRLIELAQKHGLGYTGGSDYHGAQIKKPGRLGHGNKGKLPIPESVLEIFG